MGSCQGQTSGSARARVPRGEGWSEWKQAKWKGTGRTVSALDVISADPLPWASPQAPVPGRTPKDATGVLAGVVLPDEEAAGAAEAPAAAVAAAAVATAAAAVPAGQALASTCATEWAKRWKRAGGRTRLLGSRAPLSGTLFASHRSTTARCAAEHRCWMYWRLQWGQGWMGTRSNRKGAFRPLHHVHTQRHAQT